MNRLRALVLFLLCVMCSAPQIWAAEIKFLESQHGKNLDKADFIVRYKFEQKTKKSWDESTYDDRLEFLEIWHDDLEWEESRKQGLIEAKKEENERIKETALADKEREIEILEQYQLERERLEEERLAEKEKFLEFVERSKAKIDELRVSDRGVD